MRLIALIVISILFTGCSNHSDLSGSFAKNPLKSKKDLEIEHVLTSGTWKYERQGEDCKDTNWEQTFYKNRYYKSIGSACLLANAFSVDAENWHTKKLFLYITNLSPKNGDDIVMKYGIDFLDGSKLILSRGNYQYTFLKQ